MTRDAGTPSRPKPRRVGFALHGDQRHPPQQPRDQPRSGVDAEGPVGHLAVDDCHGDGPSVGCAQEIRPEIRFHDYHQPRIVAAQETPHHETQVRREEDHACIRIVLLRRREPCRGIGGNHDGGGRVLRCQASDQRPQERDFARGRTVQPNAAPCRRRQAEAQPSRNTAPVPSHGDSVKEPGHPCQNAEKIAEIENHDPSKTRPSAVSDAIVKRLCL